MHCLADITSKRAKVLEKRVLDKYITDPKEKKFMK
jgi:hypothetical protein